MISSDPIPGWYLSAEDSRQLLPRLETILATLARIFGQPLAGTLHEALSCAVEENPSAFTHGNAPQWQQALADLPTLDGTSLHVDDGTVAIRSPGTDSPARQRLGMALAELIPWRKGPFDVAGIFIDTEWRSDWKWTRLVPHIQPLTERRVLDVGCGSGYHLWRMQAAGATAVLGIDPGLLFFHQFHAIQRYARDPRVQYLPLPLEALPTGLAAFDTVFSMGVLYHRRDPISHLRHLRECLRPGGEMVLETLVAPSAGSGSLPIDGRYARMRNLWELPGPPCLERWVEQAGFRDIRSVSLGDTQVGEQRTTRWMPFGSLTDALDSTDPSVTIEGYPRPCRAIVLARR